MKTVRMLIITAILIIITAPLFSFDNMNRQIGIIYLKNAAAYYLTGQYPESEQFLVKAKEFYSTSSDYEYLNGLIKLEKENKINEAAVNFEKALSYENWMLLDKKNCVTDLARIIFRKKEYKNLIEIIEKIAYPDYNDNDLMYLYLLSLKNDNQLIKYRFVLSQSLYRYSEDYRFGELYLYENSSYRDSILMGSQKYKNPDGYLAAFLKAAISLEDSTNKILALESYFKNGGKDISAYIEYYRLTGSLDDEKFARLLEKNIFENPANRIRLVKILPTREMREKLAAAWSAYTGNIYFDFNKDGFFEELHLYENGIPIGVSIDDNQDGVIEVMIIFENGDPSELILTNHDFIRISYDEYPAIKELSISEGSERKVYTILKDSLLLPVYEKRAIDDKIVFFGNETSLFLNNLDNLKNNAVRISTYSGGSAKDNYKYLQQELERRSESFTVLKIYNAIMGDYVYHQLNDKRTAGFADFDFDNLIDIKETYTDGDLVAIEADDNKNGRYDYKLTFDEGFAISWWDFNEDGVYDCRQFEENGVLVNEYSSGLDGVFNVIERN